jgi:hypothetical protein
METDCSGGQSCPWAVAPRGRKDFRGFRICYSERWLRGPYGSRNNFKRGLFCIYSNNRVTTQEILRYVWFFITCIFFVGFVVLTAVVMKSSIFIDIMPCSTLKGNRSFRGTYDLHLHDGKRTLSKKPASKQVASRVDILLRKVGWLSTYCAALYLRW